MSLQAVKENLKGKEDRALTKRIDLVRSTIEKEYGKGSVFTATDKPVVEVEVIPSGSLGLDAALGVGGWPRGRIAELFGMESSGKTTLTLHAIAEAQRQGGLCGFIDAEHALDLGYAKKLGVRTGELLVSQPDCGEQALEIADMMVRSSAVDLIVIDSVAALTPRAELEGEMGDTHMGLQARLMSQALRKLTAICNKSGTTILFINQLRQKIGVVFGNPYTTSGGNALKFYASVRVEVRRVKTLKESGLANASATRCKVVKNKCAPPFKEAEFVVRYGMGIDPAAELVDLGLALGVLEKSGAWISYKGERIANGKTAAYTACAALPEDMRKEIRGEVLAAFDAGKTLELDTEEDSKADTKAEEPEKPAKGKKKGGAAAEEE